MKFYFLNRMSIKNKLTYIVLITSGVAFILACFVFVIYDRVLSKNKMVYNLRILAQILGQNSSAAILFEDDKAANKLLSSLKTNNYIVSAALYDRNGVLFAEYFKNSDTIESIPPYPLSNSYSFKNRSLLLFENIIFDDEKIGTILLKSNLKELESRLKHYVFIIGIAILLSLFLIYLITSRMQKIISSPILHLSNVAKVVSAKNDYSIRANIYNEDELGFLTKSFNEMLQQIRDRDVELQGAHGELQNKAAALQKELNERKYAEEQLIESLREKEVLLKEIHHRVKNNLQIISSLLNLQSGSIIDDKSLQVFKESQNRVRSMALIHEKLYHSKDLAKIDFSEYIRSLASYLYRSYKVNVEEIDLKIDVKNVFLDVNTAIPCGLIITELVSNALKYAFIRSHNFDQNHDSRERNQIRIKIDSCNVNELCLQISDNGRNFPKSLDFRKTKSLGLQLVNMLTQQLKGTIDLNLSSETCFTIIFANSLT